MKITILDIKENTSNSLILFKSSIGNGLGCWSGTDLPKIYSTLDVELDIATTLMKDINTKPQVSTPQYRFYINTTYQIEIFCLIESLDIDNMAFLRLAEDSLIMVETMSDFSSGDFIQVIIEPHELKITPIG